MALPNAVRKQAEAADKLIAELGQSDAANVDPNANATTAATEIPTPPAATAPVAPAPASTSAPNEEFKPLTQPLGDEDATWQQRYVSLQGKYNAEVPRLQAQIKSLTQQLQHSSANPAELQTLRDEISHLKQQLAQAPAPAAPAASASLAQLRADYGDDFTNSIISIVRQELAPVQQRVDDFGSSVSKVTSANREQALKDLVTRAGVNYDQRNNDPLFIEWLAQIDPFSGAQRQELLNRAFASGDLQRAANFFTAYDGQRSGGSVTAPDLEKHIPVPSTAQQIDKAPIDQPWTQQRQDELWREKDRAARGLTSKYSAEQLAQLERELFAFLGSQRNA